VCGDVLQSLMYHIQDLGFYFARGNLITLEGMLFVVLLSFL
jgi:hypothetical protein